MDYLDSFSPLQVCLPLPEAAPTSALALLLAAVQRGLPARLDGQAPEVLDILSSLALVGVGSIRDGVYQQSKLCLYRLFGLWYLAGPQSADSPLYFGDESIALAHQVLVSRESKTLDLCAGPGISTLVAASRGASATAVEINPVASRLSTLNAQLNGLSERVEARVGDLWSATHEGERFDLISANPPLLPLPEAFDYPFPGHGGVDGLAITRRILDRLPEFLSEDGRGEIVVAMPARDGVPCTLDSVVEQAAELGLSGRLRIQMRVDATVNGPWCQATALTAVSAARGALTGAQAMYEQLLRHYEDIGANEIALGILSLWRGSDGGVDLLDMSASTRLVPWFATASTRAERNEDTGRTQG